MARYSDARGLSISTNHLQYVRNGVPDNPVITSTNQLRLTNSLNRENLVKRRASPDGFRAPTPYFHDAFVDGFAIGTLQVVQGWKSGTSDVVATVNGQLSWTGSDLGNNGYPRHLLSPSPSDFLAVPTSVKNSVKSKLRKRIKDEQWNAAVMLREMGQSVELLASSAKKLQNAMLCLVRKDWAGAARHLGVPLKKFKDGTKPAEAWLEFHFGWAPIVSDMVGAANFLATVGEHKPRLRVAAGARLEDTKPTSLIRLALPFGNVELNYQAKWAISRKAYLKALTDYKVICWFELDAGWLRDLSKIGFTNPAELLYATSPFSWLTEWLIPVGEILSGLDATIGLKFLSGTETTYQKVSLKMAGETVMDVKLNLFHAGQRFIGPPAGEFVMQGGSRTKSSRNVLTSTPFPSFLWIENPFSPWRIATSAALMRQLVPGLRSK